MGEDTLSFTYEGNITTAIMADAYVAYRAARRARKERFQFVDVLGVTSLQPEAVDTIGKVLGDLRAGGGKYVIMVASEGFTKMMGSSMSFGAGTSLVFCGSREVGFVELARLRHAAKT
jgi:hypothetical protein